MRDDRAFPDALLANHFSQIGCLYARNTLTSDADSRARTL